MKARLFIYLGPLCYLRVASSILVAIIYSHMAARGYLRTVLHRLSSIWPQNASDVNISRLSPENPKDDYREDPKDDHLEYPVYDHLEDPKDVRLDVLTATVENLRQLLACRNVSSVDLVKAYLKQIDKHNHKGMRLNAVISVAPEKDIFQQAVALDRERAEDKVRGPMHGIPVIIKASNVLISTLHNS